MFIGNKAQQAASFELQILNRLDQMDQRIEKMGKPSNFNGALAGFLSAGSDVNGTVTVGDVAVSASMCFVGIMSGGMTSAALYLADAAWINHAVPFQVGTIIGFTVCCSRLVYDGILYDFLRNLQREPKEEKTEKHTPPTVVRPYPVYDNEHQEPAPPVLYLLPNDRKISHADFVNYLHTATSLYDTYGTKAWAREAWAKETQKGYTNLGYLPGRDWAGIRQLCVEWAVRFPAFVDNKGESLVWQTNDRNKIEQFIEAVAEEFIV